MFIASYLGRALFKNIPNLEVAALSACLMISSCANNQTLKPVFGNLEITGFQFTQSPNNPLFTTAVESSIVLKNNQPIYLIDIGMTGNLSVGTSQSDLVTVSLNDRFAYVMQNNGIYYKFVQQQAGIMLYKSADLYNWILINNGQPVLTELGRTIWQSIWNVGVAVDDQGVWHLLAEASASGNENAGLGYSTATMTNDQINFDTNRSANFVIEHAGNPWLGFVQGKGLLAVYGKEDTAFWNIKAAVFDGTSWKENSVMSIGKANVHICDPHILEVSTGLIMTVSYAQDYIYKLSSNQTMASLFAFVNEYQ